MGFLSGFLYADRVVLFGGTYQRADKLFCVTFRLGGELHVAFRPANLNFVFNRFHTYTWGVIALNLCIPWVLSGWGPIYLTRRKTMYRPTDSGYGRNEMVIVRIEGGYALGRFTGETREKSESYQVDVINHITEEVRDTRHFHKEDIYELTEQNTERFAGEWVRT